MHNDQGPFLPLWAHGLGGEGWGIFGLEDLTFCCQRKVKAVNFVVTFK